MEFFESENSSKGHSLDEVIRLEKTLGTTLPERYKEFLLDGEYLSVTKKCFPRKPDVFPQGLGIDFFSTIDNILNYHDNYIDEEVKDAELMLIGQGWLGSGIICMGIGSDNQGQIFVFDWDFGPTFQANDLDDFLNSLYDYD